MGSINPLSRCQCKDIEPGLASNPLEFEGLLIKKTSDTRLQTADLELSHHDFLKSLMSMVDGRWSLSRSMV